VAVWGGGAVLCEDGSQYFDGVVFRANTAGGSGGAVWCHLSAEATISNATFCGNVSARGSALYCDGNSSAQLSNSIIGFGGETSSAVECGGYGRSDLSACNVYGNGGGDWVDCIAEQLGVDGNFSADPLFCDLVIGDLTLYTSSPCLPGNHPDGGDWGLIGARGAGCSETGIAGTIVESNWGAIKAMFR
jgi:predicted outer membrane repeat protein